MKVSNSIALSAAVAGLVAGGLVLSATPAQAKAKAQKMSCYNSCQGKSGCSGKKMPVSDTCSGHMKFKKMMTQADCEKHGGTTKAAGSSAAPAEGASAPAQGAAPAPAPAAPSGQ